MSSAAQPALIPDPHNPELRAVVAQPDDDIPRLRYADACGGTRAEFIRAQIRLAEIGPAHAEFNWLSAWSDRLLDREGAGWAPGWYAAYGIQVTGFDRGFGECVSLPSYLLGDSTLRQQLMDSAPIRHLDVAGPCQAEALREFLSSPLGQQIVTLSLDDSGLDDASLETVAAAPPLRWLSLERNQITIDGLQYLCALPSLEYVSLTGNPANPVEQFAEDEGVIVESTLPSASAELERRFGPQRWLHPRIADGRRIPVDRLALGRRAQPQGIAG